MPARNKRSSGMQGHRNALKQPKSVASAEMADEEEAPAPMTVEPADARRLPGTDHDQRDGSVSLQGVQPGHNRAEPSSEAAAQPDASRAKKSQRTTAGKPKDRLVQDDGRNSPRWRPTS